VRSLFVSIDGATAATNDRIRGGGDFHAVCANVGDAVKLRNERKLDLRIGVSCVVMKSNLDELLPLVELAARLGVDWVKLEELVAATAFAREELVDPTDDRIARAIARARALGLVAVDHVAPPPIWRCRLDPVSQAFVEADAFANRTTIHPCRAAWERACIFPNGDVAIDDFLHPVVGNVLATPLAVLWNGPEARSHRERAKAGWICDGVPTCV
jgi:MoaA/NifB/PqqE/SkfB family radical SAM enzyme